MCKMLLICSSIVGYLYAVYALPPPSYLTPCSLSDPKFNECALKSGKAGMTMIIQGDKKYNLPSLNPFKLDYVETEAGFMKIKLYKPELHGATKTELKEVYYDPKTKRMGLSVLFNEESLVGNYDISGKILILPIEGNGDLNITVYNAIFTYEFDLIKEMKNGVEYAGLKNDKLDMNLDKIYINLDNLFNGDKLLGDNINKFLNENWKDALNEAGAPIIEVLKSICFNVLSTLFLKVPFNELFLP
ncbi:unnamed protein product [Brassicogethes aeneus]|uniref:Protein takeout-like n=1 Tax=Brassicogethes aeneus TaxID=1431903 RepID=A0A9P0AY32_BRAAE|nr:unnamed protein product [Brassicogethes aeneus]